MESLGLGCAGIGVYVRSVDLWVTSLSTRSGGGALALWLQRLYSWINLDLWELDRLGLGSVSHGSCGFE